MPTLDLSADFADIVDNLQAVTLLRRESDESVAIASALRRAVTTDEAAESDGRYTSADVRWHLPVEELATRPGLGDAIVDSTGIRWTVLDVQEATLGSRWACTCRDVAIAFNLDSTITIEEATFTKGDEGASEPTWRIWRTGVRARIQPDRAEPLTQNETRVMQRRFLVYCDATLDLDHNYRLKGRDGKIYKVTAVYNAERIGEATTIEAEVTPWPSA